MTGPSDQDARIRIAEAMGWQQPFNGAWIAPGATDERYVYGVLPNPFTDANDDYAVLEWMRSNVNAWEYQFKPQLALTDNGVGTYRLGDYAHCALHVLRSCPTETEDAD